jgi:hypothetical protein
MSKPIFIIRFPYVKDIQKFQDYYRAIGEKLQDYHVLSLIDSSVERVEFECYSSPHTELEFEKLKERVMDIIEKK